MRRVVIAAADSTRELAGYRTVGVLVTLTYADGAVWSTRDVSRYIERVRKWCLRRRVRVGYQWVIELTQRGRPHYHVLLWLPKGFRVPKPDQSGMWQRGLSRIETARRPVGYLVKYATKGEEGTLPFGARLFGVGGGQPLTKLAAHRAGVPAWLDAVACAGEWLRQVPFVGWVELDTGVVHQSPYLLRFARDAQGRVVVIVERAEVQ